MTKQDSKPAPTVVIEDHPFRIAESVVKHIRAQANKAEYYRAPVAWWRTEEGIRAKRAIRALYATMHYLDVKLHPEIYAKPRLGGTRPKLTDDSLVNYQGELE